MIPYQMRCSVCSQVSNPSVCSLCTFTFTGKICVICSTESMLLSGNGSLVSKRQCIHCSQSSASHSSRISKSSIAAASSSPSSVTTKHHLVKSIYAAWHTTIITIMYLRLISQFSFNGPNFSGSFSLMQLRVPGCHWGGKSPNNGLICTCARDFPQYTSL